MYVARYTFDPRYDIRRNWSAWIGVYGATAEDLALQIADAVAHPDTIQEGDAVVSWEDASDATKIAYVLEHEDIRYHETARTWMHVHHAGLSCWLLDAETVEDAIAEARAKHQHRAIGWHGWGKATVGNVRHIADLGDNLHVFEVEDVTDE